MLIETSPPLNPVLSSTKVIVLVAHGAKIPKLIPVLMTHVVLPDAIPILVSVVNHNFVSYDQRDPALT